MSTTLKKTIAWIIIVIPSIVIILCLFLLVEIWRMRQPATQQLRVLFKETSSALKSTMSGLDVINQMATNVYSSTLYLDSATTALAQTLENTDQFIDSAGSFMGESLNNTITNTQITLESAQSSARVVDNILTALSNVPLIGLDYNPEIPLSVALGEVSATLDPLQESLIGFQENLLATQSNLRLFAGQLDLLEQNITAINQNLADSQRVIEKYQAQAASIKKWIDDASLSLPGWVTISCVVISILLILLLLVQAASMLHGIYLLSGMEKSANGMQPKDISPLENPIIESGEIIGNETETVRNTSAQFDEIREYTAGIEANSTDSTNQETAS